jgi:hypothetical protein
MLSFLPQVIEDYSTEIPAIIKKCNTWVLEDGPCVLKLNAKQQHLFAEVIKVGPETVPKLLKGNNLWCAGSFALHALMIALGKAPQFVPGDMDMWQLGAEDAKGSSVAKYASPDFNVDVIKLSMVNPHKLILGFDLACCRVAFSFDHPGVVYTTFQCLTAIETMKFHIAYFAVLPPQLYSPYSHETDACPCSSCISLDAEKANKPSTPECKLDLTQPHNIEYCRCFHCDYVRDREGIELRELPIPECKLETNESPVLVETSDSVEDESPSHRRSSPSVSRPFVVRGTRSLAKTSDSDEDDSPSPMASPPLPQTRSSSHSTSSNEFKRAQVTEYRSYVAEMKSLYGPDVMNLSRHNHEMERIFDRLSKYTGYNSKDTASRGFECIAVCSNFTMKFSENSHTVRGSLIEDQPQREPPLKDIMICDKSVIKAIVRRSLHDVDYENHNKAADPEELAQKILALDRLESLREVLKYRGRKTREFCYIDSEYLETQI